MGLGIFQYTQDYDERMPFNVGSEVNCYSLGPGVACNSIPNPNGTVSGNSNFNWIWQIQPYTKSWQLFRCPSAAKSSGTFNGNPRASYGNNSSSYLSNGVLMQISADNPGGRSLAGIVSTATLILVHEQDTTGHRSFPRPRFDTAPNYVEWLNGTNATEYDATHFEGGNLLFCDGHVKFRKKSDISAREFGLNSDLKGAQSNTLPLERDTAHVN